MVYARGAPPEEKLHSAFHAAAQAAVSFKGWVAERVVWRGESGRVVHVAPGDPPPHLAKAAAVAAHVTAALQLPPAWLYPLPPGLPAASAVHVFLHVAPPGRVAGALFVQPLEAAHRVLPGGAGGGCLAAARAAEAAGAGVRALWVAPAARRHGLATRLLDLAAQRLRHAAPLPRAQLAFSQPTAAGRALAERYSGCPAFLVYSDADLGLRAERG